MAALIKCSDCGHDVSKKAESCPNCGAPINPKKQAKKSRGCLTVFLLGVFFFVVYAISTGPSSTTSPKRSNTTHKPSDGRIEYYAKNTVNIRRGPGTDFDVVGQLDQGQMRRCYPKIAGSEWIQCAASEFIHSSLLTNSRPPTVAPSLRQADCQRKVTEAEEAGIIVRYWADPEGAHVAVDEATWNRMPYPTKLGLAVTFECAITGPDEVLKALYVHSDMTNKKLGKYFYNNLDVY